MYGDGTSIWFDRKIQKWVVQDRIVNPGQKPRKPQRRANSKREAIQIAQELRLSANASKRVLGKPTFNFVLSKYRQQKEFEVQASTLANYVHLLRLYAVPALGDRQIGDIKTRDVTELLVSLRRRGLSPSTINKFRARLIDLFKFACASDYLTDNPMVGVNPHMTAGFTKTMVQKHWSLEEAMQALDAFTGTQLELFMAFALTTGMRKGEILGLRWADILETENKFRITSSRGAKRFLTPEGDFQTKVVSGSTKTFTSTRTLYLNPIITSAIQSHRDLLGREGVSIADSDYLVLGPNNQPISLSTLHRTFTKVCQERGIRRIRIHDIRHTVAVLALEAGASLEEVSEGVGHTGTEITKRSYAPIVPGLADRFTRHVYGALAAE